MTQPARRLILMRHGQTEWNVDGRMQGNIDTELSEAGRSQAKEAARELSARRPAVVVSSDLRRAWDTAIILAENCVEPVLLRAEPRLRETGLGEWQGLDHTQVDERYTDARRRWRFDATMTPPGGENKLDVAARAVPVVRELLAELPEWADRPVILVAHGGLIAALVAALLELPVESWPVLGGLGNVSWAELSAWHTPDGANLRWRLDVWNASAKVAPMSSDRSAEPTRPVLLVVGDSLSYYGPKGGLPANDPRIWPSLVAAELGWDVELIARIGWTCRDGYWALVGDPRVWAAVPRAGAAILAVGGMDTLPSPLPTALRELIRYLRPAGLRRRTRTTYQWLQPRLSPLGWPVALPPEVSVDYLEKSRESLAYLRPEMPIVATLPSVHNCAEYAHVHTGRAPAVRAVGRWARDHGLPVVDIGAAVADNVFSDQANPDGIHWGFAGHRACADAMLKVLRETEIPGEFVAPKEVD